MFRRKIVVAEPPKVYSSVTTGLQELYQKNLLPLEKDFKFSHFYSPSLTDSDFDAKPMVLIMGQYSTGKTTFIQHLLERTYPGSRVGPEPTTDQFVAVMYGDEEQTIPGNAAVVDKTKPWSQLAEFGNAFLSRFCCATFPSALLKGMTIVDTPGVLSGDKHSSRGYVFEKVLSWFADRADLIILMFDANKLDISDEFRKCINAIRNNNTKIRVVLNKADLVSPQQLMRVYGALMWALGNVIATPEVIRVYMGSFWDEPLKNDEHRVLFESEASDLYSDIAGLPKLSTIRKLNEFIKRCRIAKVHALILTHMKLQLSCFFKASKTRELLKILESDIYPIVSRENGVAVGDFPTAEIIREVLPQVLLKNFPRLDQKKVAAVDDLLSNRIPTLMKLIPGEERAAVQSATLEGEVVSTNASPFLDSGAQSGKKELPNWAVTKYLQTPPDVMAYRDDFMELGPDESGLILGAKIKPNFVKVSGLPSPVLHRIWNLADLNNDGLMDLLEYSVARHFIAMKLDGFEVPHSLDREYLSLLRSQKFMNQVFEASSMKPSKESVAGKH